MHRADGGAHGSAGAASWRRRPDRRWRVPGGLLRAARPERPVGGGVRRRVRGAVGGGVRCRSAAPAGPIGGTGTTENALYMYNWADYVDPGNIEVFKAKFGVDRLFRTTPSTRTRR